MKKLAFKMLLSFALFASAAYGQIYTGTFEDQAYLYQNFDFVPGQRVIFFDDFSTDNWYANEYADVEQKPGVVSLPDNPNKWYKVPKNGVCYPKNFPVLPDEFTLEFDMWADYEQMLEHQSGLITNFVSNKVKKDAFDIHFERNPLIGLDIHPAQELLYCKAYKEYNDVNTEPLFDEQIEKGWGANKVHRISIHRNKTHIKVYINEKKRMDLPNGLPKAIPYTLIFSTNMWGDGIYIANVRVATDVVNAPNNLNLSPFVTNTIYFNTNSAELKAESMATLKQVAAAINATTGTVKITGHTDSDGTDADNLRLSQQRADNVKNVLITYYNVSADKLITEGKGETQPIDANNTTLAKATNRRVEFMKTAN